MPMLVNGVAFSSAVGHVDFIPVILGLAGLFWGCLLLARGGLLGGCVTVVLAGCCLGHPFYHVNVGGIPITLDRLLVAVVALQYIAYRRIGWTDPKPLGKAELALVALVSLLAASAAAHDWSANKNEPLAQLAFLYVMPVAVYWIARQSNLSERSLKWTYAALGALGLYLSVTAIAELQQLWWLVYPQFIASPEFKEFFGRARGPLLNPVGDGIFISACLAAALMWWPRLSRPGQLALLLLAAVMAAGIYCTLTRSVWFGAAAGLVLIVALSLPRNWRMAFVGCTAIVAAVTLASSWEHLAAFKRDKDLSAEDMAESAKLRPILAAVAWQMFLDRPLLGCGFGQYSLESRNYLWDRSSELPLEKVRPYVQHNVFLGLLTETGIIGMGLFVLVLGLWTQTAWRLWHAAARPLWQRQCGLLLLALIAIYVVNGMLHNVALIPMVNVLLLFVAGLTSGLAAGQSPHVAAEVRAQRLAVRELTEAGV